MNQHGLPALTITITQAARGKLCGVGRNHPATEHYEFSNHGGPLDRCETHGGEKMRDVLRGRGHEVVSRR